MASLEQGTWYVCQWWHRRCLGLRRGLTMLNIPRALRCLGYKGKYKDKYYKNIKVCFKTSNIIRGDFKPQKWIPGKILILLDPHNLYVHQNLPFLDLPKMEIGNNNWQMWQCHIRPNFDIHPEDSSLNQRTEFFTVCRHKEKHLLRKSWTAFFLKTFSTTYTKHFHFYCSRMKAKAKFQINLHNLISLIFFNLVFICNHY